MEQDERKRSTSDSLAQLNPYTQGPFSLKRRAGQEHPPIDTTQNHQLPLPTASTSSSSNAISSSSTTAATTSATAIQAAARRSQPPNSNNPFGAPFLLQSNNQIPSSSHHSSPNGLGRGPTSAGPSTNAITTNGKGKGKAVVRFASGDESITAVASSSEDDTVARSLTTHRMNGLTNGKGKGKAVERTPSSDNIELVGDLRARSFTPVVAGSSKMRTTPGSTGKGKWPVATDSDLDILLDNPLFTSNAPPSSNADDDDDEPLIFTELPPKGPLPSTASSSKHPIPPTTTKESLANLSCPICLGPPTPLAMTICGHAFCGGCLHESLASGPELTPPPELNGGLGRYNVGFGPGTGGGGGAGRGSGGARRGGRMGGGGEGELDARCPVCRTILRGGWNKSLRGLIVRMAVVED